MKRYILLRNNQESGPYSFKDLQSIGITSSDLIWIEHESTSWCHPTEFSELKKLALEGINIPLAVQPALAQQQQNETENYINAIAEKEELFTWEAKRQRRRMADLSSSFFGLGVLLVGAMLGAFVVKKLIDHFEFQPENLASQAIEINSTSLPESNASHAAKANVQAASFSAPVLSEQVTPLQEKPVTENALQKTKAVSVAEPAAKSDKESNEQVIAAIENQVDPNQSEDKPVETKEEKKEAENIEKKVPTLNLSANDYKVGMFGGISNLEISINNPSSQAVQKATVVVEFLKPNGTVVNSQTLSVENISPGDSKKLAVPANSRGVKVRYHLTNVNVGAG
jgi:hypothetical protein